MDRKDQGSSSSNPDKGKAPMVSDDATQPTSVPMPIVVVVPVVPAAAPNVPPPVPVDPQLPPIVLQQDLNQIPPAPVYPCPVCTRVFVSEKALFGHQRSHPERTWRGAHPPPTFSRTEFADVAHMLDWSGIVVPGTQAGAPARAPNQGAAPGGADGGNPGGANVDGGVQNGVNAGGENAGPSEYKVPDLNKFPPKE